MATKIAVQVSKMPVIPKACVRVCPDKVMMMYALEQAATIRVHREARYLLMGRDYHFLLEVITGMAVSTAPITTRVRRSPTSTVEPTGT